MKKEVLKAAEDMLGALNDAFERFDGDERIEGAVSDLNIIQESLQALLPQSGIYAWVCYDTDPGDVEPLQARAFSSVEEAEEALNKDINVTLENLDDVGYKASYNDVEICGYDLVLHLDDYHIVHWKRMYDPGAKGSEKDCETVHLKTVVAEPYDNDAVNGSFAITCAVPDENFDLAAAIRKASQEYVETLEGMSVYRSNCGHFGWGDFEMCVPDELCRKHGFSRVSVSQEDDVDWDECIAEPEAGEKECCGTCGFLTQDPAYDSMPTYCGCEDSENSLDWKDSPEDLADCCGCWKERVGGIRREPSE